MSHEASFDEDCKVTFKERPLPPLDMKRFQKAMFADDPSAHHCQPIAKRPGRKPEEGQIVLFDERPPCKDGDCKKKRERRSK